MCLGVQVGADQGLGAVGQLAGACDWEPDIGLDSVRFAVYVKFSPGRGSSRAKAVCVCGLGTRAACLFVRRGWCDRPNRRRTKNRLRFGIEPTSDVIGWAASPRGNLRDR